MNAKDIAKALKCCYALEGNGFCDGCPYIEYHAGDLIESLLAQLDAAIAGQETLQKALAESQRRERAAVEDLTYFAGAITTGEPCSRCIYNPDDMGCELDGSQYDDDGECHFTWRGPQEGEGNAETDNPD